MLGLRLLYDDFLRMRTKRIDRHIGQEVFVTMFRVDDKNRVGCGFQTFSRTTYSR